MNVVVCGNLRRVGRQSVVVCANMQLPRSAIVHNRTATRHIHDTKGKIGQMKTVVVEIIKVGTSKAML